MKGLTGEWRDLKEWTAYLIDLLSRGKRDVTALKALIVLALIVIPGGILLQSSGDVFHGASAVLSPMSSLFHGLLSGPAPAATPDDRTHTGVFDPDFKPTPYVWQGRTDTPSSNPQGNTTPTPTPVPGSGPSTAPTPAPTQAPVQTTTPTPTNAPTSTPGPTDTPTPVPTGTPTPTPVPTGTPTPTPQDQITVHVHDGSAPIEGATVTIGSQTVTTDASGDAVFTLDRDATVNIHVSSAGYDAYDTAYTPDGEATVDVTLALTPTPTPTPVPTPTPTPEPSPTPEPTATPEPDPSPDP